MSDDLLTVCLMAFSWLYGFLWAWAICHDGKSLFWTGFMDVFSLRILWQGPSVRS